MGIFYHETVNGCRSHASDGQMGYISFYQTIRTKNQSGAASHRLADHKDGIKHVIVTLCILYPSLFGRYLYPLL